MKNKMNYPKGKIAKLSKNFNSDEFDCRCKFESCRVTKIDPVLVKKLQEKRDEWGGAITINSGYRCTKWNQAVRGVKHSQHLSGKAADIIVKGKSPKWVAKQCEDFNGLGRYRSFTHVDVRGKKARWGR